MEIIEKQVEKTKEVPYGYWENCGYGRNVNGKANAGLTLGIIGTVLGGAALLGRRNGFNLFGNSAGTSGSDANIAIASCGGVGSGYGYAAPTAFQAWEKSCEDTLALQKGLYDWALAQQSQRFADRQTLNAELFSVWKSQVDADFGLYKSTRDGFDVLSAKQNADAFNLYKSQRDADDSIRQELSDLKAQVAINAQYHDYCELFKSWFGDGVEQKIIESAVIFWFKDDDYKDGFKLWNYFKED